MENTERVNRDIAVAISNGEYIQGAFKDEAAAFLKKCVGEEKYEEIMKVDAGRKHPYVAARVFLSEGDWKRYVWIEQFGSLDGYSE